MRWSGSECGMCPAPGDDQSFVDEECLRAMCRDSGEWAIILLNRARGVGEGLLGPRGCLQGT